MGEDEKDVCEGAEPDERLLDLGARRDGSSRERTGRMEEEGGQYGQRVEERKKGGVGGEGAKGEERCRDVRRRWGG